MIRVLISGSRKHTNAWGVENSLIGFVGANEANNLSVIHGACPHPRDRMHGRSVDMIADETFKMQGVKVQGFPADWNKHGKAAGMIRNQFMVDAKPDLVIAYPCGESPGTRNCIKIAQKAGLQVVVKELEDLSHDPTAPF